MRSRTGALVVFLLVSALAALADQYTKRLALQYLSPDGPTEVLPFMNLVIAFNRGAAFGFLNEESGWQLFLFISIALVVLVYLVVHIWQEAYRSVLSVLAYAFIAGGAVGNLIDRVNMGYVVDFVDLHIAGWHFWVFNLADCALSIGVALLLLSVLIEIKQRRAQDSVKE